jgi:hypothetical protein
MTSTFLDRNKKKSSLAALLLLLRQRKLAVLLLLLVVGATTLFVTPSSYWSDMPGGSRMAASVAWLAQKMGVDVSRWGFTGRGPISFRELISAFGSARTSRRVGWGPFFTQPAPDKAAAGAGSVGYVKGEDLGGPNSGRGADGKTGGAAGSSGPFQQILDPNQKDKGDEGLALSEADLGGQRESFVKQAFAGGFFNGLLNTAGDASGLSGGAYAGKGFFSGSVGAATGGPGGSARSGLQSVPIAAIPSSRVQAGAGGHISSAFAQSIDARSMAGVAKASELGSNSTYTKLAQANGQAQLSIAPNCSAPNCPSEFAASQTGAVYDGNATNGGGTGIITATPVDGTSSPNIPNSGIAQNYVNQANQMSQDAATCQALDNQYGPQEDALNSQMQSLSTQFQSAGCGSGGCSQSKLNYCNGIASQLRSTCGQYMTMRCNQTKACPLTAADAATTCSSECQQVGNGVTAQTAGDVGNSDGVGAQTAQ